MALLDFGDILEKLEKLGKAWEVLVGMGAAAGGAFLWLNRKRKLRRERRHRLGIMVDQYDTIIGKLTTVENTVGENTVNISGISAMVSGFTSDMQGKLSRQKEEFDERIDKFEQHFRDEIRDLRGDVFDLARGSK